jgi:hypothetical protein
LIHSCKSLLASSESHAAAPFAAFAFPRVEDESSDPSDAWCVAMDTFDVEHEVFVEDDEVEEPGENAGVSGD